MTECTWVLKGQFNEMELALFRQRSLESRLAMRNAASCCHAAAGYEKVDRNSHRDDSGPAPA